MLKANMFADSFFKRFFFQFSLMFETKFRCFLIDFWIRSENVNFVKIMLPPAREHDFSGFEGFEINKKSNFHVNLPLVAPNLVFRHILVKKIFFGHYDVIAVGKCRISVKNQLC